MTDEAPDRPSVLQLLETVVDDGTFESWDQPLVSVPGSTSYDAALTKARERSGLDESVLTGKGLVRGRPVALIGCDFSFLAGSIGVAAAERLVSAVERATAEGLPLLATTASGGTRMQEGTIAFLQMVKITAAITAHKAAGLPYLVYLRHPTTGGVFASWGSLGHVTIAQPQALVGFLGPRVYEALYDAPFPEGVQTAENLHRCGLLDGVIPAEGLAGLIDRALAVLMAPRRLEVPRVPDEDLPDVEAWESVTRSRDERRPGVRALLRHAATDVVPLNGTGEGESDPSLLLALARFSGAPCVVLGQDRARQTTADPLGPAALRTARRGMRLAEELGLPLVTVIDTAGAALSPAAEEGGLAGEIARCLADLITTRSPTVSVLLGQGSGGAALALLPADRVVAAQHGWLSPLPPEGASAIVHRTAEKAPQMAAEQGVRSADLAAAGIVDRIVVEHPDAAEESEAFCTRMGATLSQELAAVLGAGTEERLAARWKRYRTLGLPG
ncbi:carboxyl transferase domain-containing protein [Rhodococcus sp. X156]|uniref:carboxyl transferase domain-containing protein n=1 Tax=Rhodococcus sp. X156 TaxID=2499145 RepID=UPI000FDB4B95|nr:carboxyl transferase domain-containing protein [Rhodococcus sp. X156]